MLLAQWECAVEEGDQVAVAECHATQAPSACSGGEQPFPTYTVVPFPLFRRYFQLLGPKCLKPVPSHTVVLSGIKGTDAANVFVLFLFFFYPIISFSIKIYNIYLKRFRKASM